MRSADMRTQAPIAPQTPLSPAAIQTPQPSVSSIVAVYPHHASAEQAVRLLHKDRYSMSDLSIVGRDFQVSEEPVGFVNAGAGTGAWVGGLFGLLVGAAFLVLPGVGPVVIAGPLLVALLGGLEGAVAGATIGWLSGALVVWGIPREEALKHETQVKASKFLVVARGTQVALERARHTLAPHTPERLDVYAEGVTI
jgi:uncharacterized membrane protein